MVDPIETYLTAVKSLCPKFSEEELEYFRSVLSITELQPKHFYIQENPDLFNRVSLSHLASFLGMERQTLTRIRQKLVKV